MKNTDIKPNLNKPSLFSWLRGRFFAGIVIAAPIAITFVIIRWVIGMVDGFVKPLLPPQFIPDSYLPYAIPGFGLVVAVIVLTVLGAVASNLIGKSFFSAADRLMGRVPFVSNVYTAVRQLFDVVGQGGASSYKEVVMVEYPRRGSWAMGFVSGPPRGELAHCLDPNMIAVFIPTTPNPTSGFLIFVLRSEAKPLQMSVEEGAKFILSAGLVAPDFDGKDASLAHEALSHIPDENTGDATS